MGLKIYLMFHLIIRESMNLWGDDKEKKAGQNIRWKYRVLLGFCFSMQSVSCYQNGNMENPE